MYLRQRTWLENGPAPRRSCAPNYSRRRAAGLGDAASCGPDPCTWFDWVWSRDACLTYLGCSNPADPRYVGMQPGADIFTGAGAAVGEAAGQVVSGVTTGITSPQGLGVNGTVLALAAVLGVFLLVRK